MSLAAQEWDCPSPCCVSKVGQSLLEREASGASAKRTSACGANPSTLMCSSLLMAFQGCIRDFCNVNCISGHHKSPRVGSSGPGGGWWAWFGRMMGKELQSVARGVLGFGNCSLCPAARVPQAHRAKMFFSGIWEVTEVPHPQIVLSKETLKCKRREGMCLSCAPSPVAWGVRSCLTILVLILSTVPYALWEPKCKMLLWIWVTLLGRGQRSDVPMPTPLLSLVSGWDRCHHTACWVVHQCGF